MGAVAYGIEHKRTIGRTMTDIFLSFLISSPFWALLAFGPPQRLKMAFALDELPHS